MQANQITPEKEINMAVKAVAGNFKEDQEKVEAELIEKLSSLNLAKQTTTEETIAEETIAEETIAEDLDVIDSQINNEVNEKLMSSVEEVAATISEKPIPPRSKLAQRLLRLSLDKKVSSEEKKSMRSVIENMKLESNQPVKAFKMKQMERRELQQMERRQTVAKPIIDRKIDLFGSSPLNIFKLDAEVKADSRNVLWQKLQSKQLRHLTQFAPANAFEEMIMWTEEGKHWKFPIDNETEMGAEENVGFHEHVFLDHHLKGFPTKGPVRHFMELVVVGLSKNPYITVERKVENIEWFRNYFQEKEDVLRHSGAIE